MNKKCDCCGAPYRNAGLPKYFSYRGMPFNCCDYCSMDHKWVELKMEPRWQIWASNHNPYNKPLEEQNMCHKYSPAGPTNKKEEFPAKGGEKWYIDGKEFTIGTSGHKYFESNGDPDKLYATMRDENGVLYIITEDAFLKKAVREPKLVDKHISPDKLMRADPCIGGVRALCQVLGIKDYGDTFYSMVKALTKSGELNVQRSVNEFYGAYWRKFGEAPGDSYLLFVAKALNLVPKDSKGPDRATLCRMLGIKE